MDSTTKYYVNQAGNGLHGYQGKRYQKGRGFLGDLFKNKALPLLSYLGKQALNTGIGIAQDAVSGENILDSTKKRAKRTADNIAGDFCAERAEKFAQTGSGVRNKKRKKKSRKTFKKQKVRRIKRKRSLKNKKLDFLNVIGK